MYTAYVRKVQEKKLDEMVRKTAEELEMRDKRFQPFEVLELKMFYWKKLFSFHDDVNQVVGPIHQNMPTNICSKNAHFEQRTEDKWLHATNV